MTMPRYSPTGRIGINATERIVVKELGWIFREQPVVDQGIDAHIERVDNGEPTGKLVALQIKTGSSHFKEKTDCYIYYGTRTHLDYWLGHSLPVVLIAHVPEQEETYWVHVNEANIARTEKRWRIAIPKSNVLGSKTKDSISAVFEGSPAQQRLRKLLIDEPLMRHISDGGKVSVQLEEWVNKSLGRTPVEIFVQNEAGEDELSREWFQYYTGYSVEELVAALFPWAASRVDEDFYDVHADDEYDPDDWREAMTHAILRGDDSDSHISSRPAIYPYTEMAGEVEYYRLQLYLNDLGRSFLLVSDYLAGIHADAADE
jgi:Domain of unknown function (DUF4365)